MDLTAMTSKSLAKKIKKKRHGKRSLRYLDLWVYNLLMHIGCSPESTKLHVERETHDLNADKSFKAFFLRRFSTSDILLEIKNYVVSAYRSDMLF